MQLGVEARNRLTHFGSTISEGAVCLRDKLPCIDLGQRLKFPTTGLPKVAFALVERALSVSCVEDAMEHLAEPNER